MFLKVDGDPKTIQEHHKKASGRQPGRLRDHEKRPLKLEQKQNRFFAGNYLGGTSLRGQDPENGTPNIYRYTRIYGRATPVLDSLDSVTRRCKQLVVRTINMHCDYKTCVSKSVSDSVQTQIILYGSNKLFK